MQEYILAVLGVCGTIVTIGVSEIFKQIAELRKIKESQYIDFLGSLAEAIGSD